MKEVKWIRCPVCGNKTRNRIREDSVLTLLYKFLTKSAV